MQSKADVIKVASEGTHVKGHGKNFQPLIAAGSWTICNFTYGKSKCACCGRPITRVLHLKNESHHQNSPFSEKIEIGIVCGPKVFIESCVGFYNDPAREWDRQHRAWKDYIEYVIVCVKHEKMWELIPVDLRSKIDEFLKVGYESQNNSGGWWMARDAKKKYLKSQRQIDVIPEPKVLYAASRGLMYAAKRQNLVPNNWTLKCDWETGTFELVKEENNE